MRVWRNNKSHYAPKKSQFLPMRGESYKEIEYMDIKVLQRRRGSGGNVRLSHLLMTDEFLVLVGHKSDSSVDGYTCNTLT